MAGGGSSDASPELNRGVYALFVVFGLGSWITINGLFAELPVFLHDLPEGEKIFADLGLAVQLANVAPLVYGALRPRGTPVRATATVLLLGAAAVAATGSLWRRTAVVGGRDRSVALLAGVYCCAAVDCTTTLLFWPFAAEFRSRYVTALAAGEGATGVLATALVLVQLRGRLGSTNLLFSVDVYFWFMSLVVLASLAAFVALLVGSGARAERVHAHAPHSRPASRSAKAAAAAAVDPAYEKLLGGDDFAVNDDGRGNGGGNAEGGNGSSIAGSDDDDSDDGGCDQSAAQGGFGGGDGASTARRLVLVLAWLSALQNGVKPAVLPYAVRTSASLEAAQLAGLCVDPIGALCALWAPPRAAGHAALTAAWTACVAAMVVAAVAPAAVGTDRGAGAMCAVSIAASFLLAYSKASALLFVKRCASAMVDRGEARSGGADPTSVLFRAGAWIQGGSFVGSSVMWALVNYAHVF